MDLIELYKVAEKEHLTPYNVKIDNVYGCYINNDGITAIAMNYEMIKSEKKEKEVLSEELSHHQTGAYYPIECTNKLIIDKLEYKAKKHTYTRLVPFDELKKLIDNKRDIEEISDYFGVTIEFLNNCITYYKKGLFAY